MARKQALVTPNLADEAGLKDDTYLMRQAISTAPKDRKSKRGGVRHRKANNNNTSALSERVEDNGFRETTERPAKTTKLSNAKCDSGKEIRNDKERKKKKEEKEVKEIGDANKDDNVNVNDRNVAKSNSDDGKKRKNNRADSVRTNVSKRADRYEKSRISREPRQKTTRTDKKGNHQESTDALVDTPFQTAPDVPLSTSSQTSPFILAANRVGGSLGGIRDDDYTTNWSDSKEKSLSDREHPPITKNANEISIQADAAITTTILIPTTEVTVPITLTLPTPLTTTTTTTATTTHDATEDSGTNESALSVTIAVPIFIPVLIPVPVEAGTHWENQELQRTLLEHMSLLNACEASELLAAICDETVTEPHTLSILAIDTNPAAAPDPDVVVDATARCDGDDDRNNNNNAIPAVAPIGVVPAPASIDESVSNTNVLDAVAISNADTDDDIGVAAGTNAVDSTVATTSDTNTIVIPNIATTAAAAAATIAIPNTPKTATAVIGAPVVATFVTSHALHVTSDSGDQNVILTTPTDLNHGDAYLLPPLESTIVATALSPLIALSNEPPSPTIPMSVEPTISHAPTLVTVPVPVPISMPMPAIVATPCVPEFVIVPSLLVDSVRSKTLEQMAAISEPLTGGPPLRCFTENQITEKGVVMENIGIGVRTRMEAGMRDKTSARCDTDKGEAAPASQRPVQASQLHRFATATATATTTERLEASPNVEMQASTKRAVEPKIPTVEATRGIGPTVETPAVREDLVHKNAERLAPVYDPKAMPLQDSWVFYAHSKSGHWWNGSQTRMRLHSRAIDHVAGLLSIIHHAKSPATFLVHPERNTLRIHGVPVECYSAFRYGAAPAWEDPVNAHGVTLGFTGKWTSGSITAAWTHTILALAGHTLCENVDPDVAGIRIIHRRGSVRLELWIRGSVSRGKMHETIDALRCAMIQLLESPDVCLYKPMGFECDRKTSSVPGGIGHDRSCRHRYTSHDDAGAAARVATAAIIDTANVTTITTTTTTTAATTTTTTPTTTDIAITSVADVTVNATENPNAIANATVSAHVLTNTNDDAIVTNGNVGSGYNDTAVVAISKVNAKPNNSVCADDSKSALINTIERATADTIVDERPSASASTSNANENVGVNASKSAKGDVTGFVLHESFAEKAKRAIASSETQSSGKSSMYVPPAMRAHATGRLDPGSPPFYSHSHQTQASNKPQNQNQPPQPSSFVRDPVIRTNSYNIAKTAGLRHLPLPIVYHSSTPTKSSPMVVLSKRSYPVDQ